MDGADMPPEPKRGAKTEVLSIRMDPKTRFVVEFVARIRGQSITTVVERSLQETADRTSISNNDALGHNTEKTWRDYWHISEGIRWIMVASEPMLYPTFEEEYKMSFIEVHWPFFYTNSRRNIYKEWSIDVIWPRIDEFVDIWTRTKTTDYFAAGKAMQDVIRLGGLKPPDWPVKVEEKPASPRRPNADLDDEIPF
jgi:hypothetical protein